MEVDGPKMAKLHKVKDNLTSTWSFDDLKIAKFTLSFQLTTKLTILALEPLTFLDNSTIPSSSSNWYWAGPKFPGTQFFGSQTCILFWLLSKQTTCMLILRGFSSVVCRSLMISSLPKLLNFGEGPAQIW